MLRFRAVWVLLVTLAVVAASVLVTDGAAAVPAGVTVADPAPIQPMAATDGERYVPMAPARLMDTRAGNATVDGQGPKGAVPGPGQIELLVAGRAGIPESGVGSVVLNVTVTQPTERGWVTVWPTGQGRPLASNLNYTPGLTVPNMVIAKVGDRGKVSLFNNTGTTHLIVDVMGWYPVASDYQALTPARVMDSRAGTATVDGQGPKGALVGPGAVEVQLTGRAGIPASGVGAVVLNVTVTQPIGRGWVTVWPTGQGRPLASNLNYTPGQTVPNMVIAKVSADGKVSLFNNTGSTHLIVDVMGWFPTDSYLQPMSPARLADTRAGAVTADGQGPKGAVAGGTSIDVAVTGRAGIPATGVGAVVLNVTVTGPTERGWVTAWPTGELRPLASNLNYTPGQSVPNMVIAKVGADGEVSLFNNTGSTHLIVDVLAWIPDYQPERISEDVLTPAPDQVSSPAGADAAGNAQLTLTTPESPAVGEVVVVPPGGNFPTGYIGRVTTATPTTGGTAVTTAPGFIYDVLPQANLSVDLDTGVTTLTDPALGVQTLGTVAPQAAAGGQFVTVTAKCSAGTVTASADVSLGTLNFTGDGIWPSTVWAQATLNPSAQARFVLGLGASAGCTLSASAPKYVLPPIRTCIPMPVGCLPFWWNHSLQVKLDGSLAAEGTIGFVAQARADATLGFRVGKDARTITEVRFTAGAQPVFDAGVRGNAWLHLDYDGAAYGVAGLVAGFGPELDLKVNPAANPWLTLDSRLRGQLTGYIDVSVRRFDSPAVTLRYPDSGWRLWSIGTKPGPTPGVGDTRIAAGNVHACAIVAGGAVKCWGHNGYGRLGDGTETNRYRPVSVAGLTGVTALTAGASHTCAIVTGGTVKCWGANDSGQLGDGTATNRYTPVIVAGLTGVTALTAGYDSTCAIVTGGTVKCWGANDSGQLGDGTATNRYTPISVAGLTGATAINAGAAHACALVTGGTVKCWGDNIVGQLGDGTATNRYTPVSVAGLTGATTINAGTAHTCAIVTGGTVKCWGWNGNAQLGDGTTTNRHIPITVTGLTGTTALAVGYNHTCALASGGTVKCWGYNGYGQLGDGTNSDRSTPVSVAGVAGATALTVGYRHTCALASGGTVKCWGDNDYGQLGDGTTTRWYTPVTVAGLTVP